MKKLIPATAALALALAAGSALAETTYPSAGPQPHAMAPTAAPYGYAHPSAYADPTAPYSGFVWYDTQRYHDGVE
jgi:hypothetical protein